MSLGSLTNNMYLHVYITLVFSWTFFHVLELSEVYRSNNVKGVLKALFNPYPPSKTIHIQSLHPIATDLDKNGVTTWHRPISAYLMYCMATYFHIIE